MALADGSDKMQAEVRLVQRIGDADAALHESRMEVRGVIHPCIVIRFDSPEQRGAAFTSGHAHTEDIYRLATHAVYSETYMYEATVMWWWVHRRV